MEPDGREQAPPLAGRHGLAVHHSRRLKSDLALEPIKDQDQKEPRGAAPIEAPSWDRQILTPGPAAIFELILLEGGQRFVVMLGGDSQRPGVVLLAIIDDRLDFLAEQNQAPIHGLAARANGDFQCQELHVFGFGSCLRRQ